jgi:tRNA1(Val) A37 N6-methylase TrmN6
MGDRVEVVSADLTLPLSRTPELASRVGTFHSVVANPPYYDASSGTRASDPLKANAHAMAGGSLDDWARFLAAMAAPDGQLTLIHRADRLDEILAVLDRRFGALTLCPIHSRSTEPANRILITGRKSSRAPLTIRPGLVLHDATGYRSEIEAVLRHGAALPD